MYSLMWSEHCGYKHSRPLLAALPDRAARASCRAPARTPASSTSATAGPSPSRSRATTTRARSSPSRARPPASAASCATSSHGRAALRRHGLPALRRARPSRAQRYLFDGVVGGIGYYGNCLGVPTVGGEVYFEPSYDGNCLVNAMAVGLMRTDGIVRAIASGVGNPSCSSAPTPAATASAAPASRQPEFDETLEEKRPQRPGRRPVHREEADRGLPGAPRTASSWWACRTWAPPASPAPSARWPARAASASTSTSTACRCARPTWSPTRS